MYKRLVLLTVILLLGCVGTVALGDLNAGLVAHWDFEGNFNDSAGTNHATVIGDAKVVTDAQRGQVLELDGNGDYLEVPSSPSLNITGDKITLAAWVWHDDVSGDPEIIIAKVFDNTNHSNPYFSYGLHILTNGQPRCWLRLAGNVYAPGTPTMQSGRWYHLAGVYDGKNLTLYVDGVVVQTQAATGNITGYDNVLRLGTNGGLTEQMDGKMDDVRIYDRDLSEREVQSLFTGIALNKAWEPSPADGATAVTSPLFQWGAGDTGVFHDVYLGTSPDLGPADLVAPRQPMAMYWHAPGLEPGVTYYWRVDEMEMDMTTVHTGDVWSFSTLPATAHLPQPADAADLVPPGQPELEWTTGLNALSHDVYFGADADQVANGTGDTFQGNQTATTFAPGALADGTIYYWRIDEVAVDGTKVIGPVWSFTTLPEVSATVAGLAGWWKLDEGSGTTAVDWSGNGNHGTLNGSPQWVEGLVGGALDLEFDNTNECVVVPAFDVPAGGITLAAWVKPESFSQHDARIIDKGRDVASANDAYWMLSTNSSGSNYVLRFRLKTDESQDTTTMLASSGGLTAGEWAHVAAIWDGTSMILYQDAVEVGRVAKGGTVVAASATARVYIGNQLASSQRRPWDGLIDDVRVYSEGLTVEELKDVMRGDPLLAWDPSPGNGVTTDGVKATMLSWQAGEKAAEHDVYLGTDRAAVKSADTSDATGVYRGRLGQISYTPAPALEWGNEYFWRVDEVSSDGTIAKGYLWNFVVADYLIVDDFEAYNDDVDAGTTIYDTWIDGWTNDTGATVGYLVAPFAEQGIIHGGKQSMPLSYDNSASPYYSETERTFDTAQDWTVNGMSTLQLYVQGRMEQGSVSFDSAAQTYTMVGAGSNIWGQNDQFHFAFKELTGDGSIVLRVDRIMQDPPHGDPRIGVMMRDTLDPNAANAMLFVEPDPRIRLTQRVRVADETTNVAVAATGTTPVWLRLTREGFVFKAEMSNNGTTWTPLVDTGSQASIFMTDPVYVGLVVCSHASGRFVDATFSNVKTTGQITPSGPFTASQDVGIASNSAQPLYVRLQDSANHSAVVTNADVVTTDTWTAWKIPLADFAGVDASAVKKVLIGIGDSANPAPDGTGVVYIDDIQTTK